MWEWVGGQWLARPQYPDNCLSADINGVYLFASINQLLEAAHANPD